MSADPSTVSLSSDFIERRRFSALCSTTVFLGAFLLFLVEPLFAKIILPWFGGSAAVWATCLVFFQTALMLGYYYADLTSRKFKPNRQISAHLLLLLGALISVWLLFVPLVKSSSWHPAADQDPFWRILLLLTIALGLPYTLLSTTSPLIQTWYGRSRAGAEPYHLFAL